MTTTNTDIGAARRPVKPFRTYEEWQEEAKQATYAAFTRLWAAEHELAEARKQLAVARSHPACQAYDAWCNMEW